nr:MAG TPA: hypothetical protein [Caudoviricetes sp.]
MSLLLSSGAVSKTDKLRLITSDKTEHKGALKGKHITLIEVHCSASSIDGCLVCHRDSNVLYKAKACASPVTADTNKLRCLRSNLCLISCTREERWNSKNRRAAILALNRWVSDKEWTLLAILGLKKQGACLWRKYPTVKVTVSVRDLLECVNKAVIRLNRKVYRLSVCKGVKASARCSAIHNGRVNLATNGSWKTILKLGKDGLIVIFELIGEELNNSELIRLHFLNAKRGIRYLSLFTLSGKRSLWVTSHDWDSHAAARKLNWSCKLHNCRLVLDVCKDLIGEVFWKCCRSCQNTGCHT